MNGDPYRTSQPSDRRVINRGSSNPPAAPTGSYRQSDKPQLERDDETPRVSTPAMSYAGDGGKKKSHKGLVWTIIVLIFVALLAAGGWYAWSSTKSAPTGIDSSRYQAVFLTNGQIYFGKLESFNDESFKITSVYLADSATENDETAEATGTAANSTINLVPVTNSVHGPEDEMILMKEQILFYENLKADSQAAKLIEQNKK